MNSRRSPVSRGSSSPPRTSVIPISIVNQLLQKPFSVASATAFNTTKFNVSRQPLDHFSSEKNQPRNRRHKKLQRQPPNIHRTSNTRKWSRPRLALLRLNNQQRSLNRARPTPRSQRDRQRLGIAEYTDRPRKDPPPPPVTFPAKKGGPPTGGPPHAPSRNRTENLLIKSQLL